MTNEQRYLVKHRLLDALRESGRLTLETEDAILDELDELWDACDRQEKQSITEYYKQGKEG